MNRALVRLQLGAHRTCNAIPLIHLPRLATIHIYTSMQTTTTATLQSSTTYDEHPKPRTHCSMFIQGAGAPVLTGVVSVIVHPCICCNDDLCQLTGEMQFFGRPSSDLVYIVVWL